MTTEFERRFRLINKTMDLTETAIEQRDDEQITLLLRNNLRLIITQVQAMELASPGYISEIIKQKPFLELWEKLGVTDREVIEQIYRGQADPFSA